MQKYSHSTCRYYNVVQLIYWTNELYSDEERENIMNIHLVKMGQKDNGASRCTNTPQIKT